MGGRSGVAEQAVVGGGWEIDRGGCEATVSWAQLLESHLL